jgi:hypothetical protein
MESAVTDFPEPDSPTIPSVAPRSSEKLTPSTAWTTPSRVKKCVLRSVISRSASYVSFVRGSRASRMPSEMKYEHMTISVIASDGTTISCG